LKTVAQRRIQNELVSTATGNEICQLCQIKGSLQPRGIHVL